MIDGPIDPDIMAGAKMMWDTYCALLSVGFSEEQAMKCVVAMLVKQASS